MKILLAALLVVFAVYRDCALLHASVSEELVVYENRVLLLLRAIAGECPQLKEAHSRQKRDFNTSASLDIDLEIEKILYKRLKNILMDCRATQGVNSTTTPTTATLTISTTTTPVKTTTTTTTPTTTPTTSTPTTTPTTNPTTTTSTAIPRTTPTTAPTTTHSTTHSTSPTTTPTTTTPITVPVTTTTQTTTTTTTRISTAAAPTSTTSAISTTQRVPNECLTAKNLTESWRLDHNFGDIRPGGRHSNSGYACDLHNDDTEWFRFTGAAGTRMLNTCPKWRSCGTYYPLWTDDAMPTAVGVATDIRVYRAHVGRCKGYSRPIQVMRCSEAAPHDYIYRQGGFYSGNCGEAFCGMM